jgi:hypothetical protein
MMAAGVVQTRVVGHVGGPEYHLNLKTSGLDRIDISLLGLVEGEDYLGRSSHELLNPSTTFTLVYRLFETPSVFARMLQDAVPEVGQST